MLSTIDLLAVARSAPPKDSLDAHLTAIVELRAKGYTWREIATFLTDNGVPTDHSKVFRLVAKHQRLESETAAFQVPASAEYLKGLKGLDAKGRVSAAAKAMLGRHFLAHNRTVTYTQLAQAAATAGRRDAAGASHRTANSTYGKLGRALGEAIDMSFAPDEHGNPFYSSALGLANPMTPAGAEFELVMHHELAKAIEQLGWFK
jgi:hypothetical protein